MPFNKFLQVIKVCPVSKTLSIKKTFPLVCFKFLDREKSKETCLIKYGVENWMSSNEFRLKSFKTKLEKYGNGNFVNHNKYKETCLNKYGVDNFGKTQESILKTHTKEVNEKRELTKKKNGTLNSSKTESYIFLIKSFDCS